MKNHQGQDNNLLWNPNVSSNKPQTFKIISNECRTFPLWLNFLFHYTWHYKRTHS